MRKIILFIAGIVLFSCESKENIPALKTMTVSEYLTREENGKIVKGEIQTQYSIGFRPDSTQLFFVGLVGYPSNGDTSFHDHSGKLTLKNEGNKTFLYTEKNELFGVNEKIGDTTFFYLASNLDDPRSYRVNDSENKLVSEGEFLLNIHKSYLEPVYDEYGSMVYAIIQEEYIPDDLDISLYSEMELAKRKVENRRSLILEVKLEYY